MNNNRYENWRELKPLEAPVPVGTEIECDFGEVKG